MTGIHERRDSIDSSSSPPLSRAGLLHSRSSYTESLLRPHSQDTIRDSTMQLSSISFSETGSTPSLSPITEFAQTPRPFSYLSLTRRDYDDPHSPPAPPRCRSPVVVAPRPLSECTPLIPPPAPPARCAPAAPAAPKHSTPALVLRSIPAVLLGCLLNILDGVSCPSRIPPSAPTRVRYSPPQTA
ncbi:hypothetical protein C0992_010808 [Termitomyces sp. T32_za158]|nr:hypothetical protein C0992_010808 [Termitomyces sp. T32_za158]